MKARVLLSFGVLAALALPVPVNAATGSLPATVLRTDSAAYARGSRVRLTMAGTAKREVGTVRRLTPAAILLVTDDPGEYRSIPWTSVAGVERSSSRHGHTAVGLVMGTIAGFVIGSMATSGASEESGFGPPASFFTVLGCAGGGMLLGGIVGVSIQSDEWERVAPPIEPLPAKDPVEIKGVPEGGTEGS